MGTTTFYLKHNDIGTNLKSLKKKELEILDHLSPYGKESDAFGWRVPIELHNGNVYVLIFWKGKLMKLEDASKQLNKKYWDRYKGKTCNIYEWSLLKKFMLNQIEYLDKQFKIDIRKGNKIKP